MFVCLFAKIHSFIHSQQRQVDFFFCYSVSCFSYNSLMFLMHGFKLHNFVSYAQWENVPRARSQRKKERKTHMPQSLPISINLCGNYFTLLTVHRVFDVNRFYFVITLLFIPLIKRKTNSSDISSKRNCNNHTNQQTSEQKYANFTFIWSGQVFFVCLRIQCNSYTSLYHTHQMVYTGRCRRLHHVVADFCC